MEYPGTVPGKILPLLAVTWTSSLLIPKTGYVPFFSMLCRAAMAAIHQHPYLYLYQLHNFLFFIFCVDYCMLILLAFPVMAFV